MANAGIVDLGDAVLIFDSFATVRAAADLKKAAEDLTKRSIRYVINSHPHMDHFHGNQVFSESVIISTHKTRELIGTHGPAFLQYARSHPEFLSQYEERMNRETDSAKREEMKRNLGDFRAIGEELPDIDLKLPALTFTEAIEFHGSRRSARLLTYGGGHSPSDALLYLPEERIAFMGDLLSVQTHAAMKHGDDQEWLRILDQVLTLPLESAVPGHGPVGDVQDVKTQRQYILDLQELARDRLERGNEPAEDVPIPVAYRCWQAPSIFAENLSFLIRKMSSSAEQP